MQMSNWPWHSHRPPFSVSLTHQTSSPFLHKSPISLTISESLNAGIIVNNILQLSWTPVRCPSPSPGPVCHLCQVAAQVVTLTVLSEDRENALIWPNKLPSIPRATHKTHHCSSPAQSRGLSTPTKVILFLNSLKKPFPDGPEQAWQQSQPQRFILSQHRR